MTSLNILLLKIMCHRLISIMYIVRFHLRLGSPVRLLRFIHFSFQENNSNINDQCSSVPNTVLSILYFDGVFTIRIGISDSRLIQIL